LIVSASALVPVVRFSGHTAVLDRANIDTDLIVPARFLTSTKREGFGAALFAGWRFDAEGRERADFPLHAPDARDASVLVTGDNFGCGSSREHAVWALGDFGFRAVVATSFADIFRQNALKNQLLPIVVDAVTQRALAARPGVEVTIDVERLEIAWAGGSARFPLDPFARRCLLDGVDELGYLLASGESIARFEQARIASQARGVGR
jgi:3-isopropylmalate/(R)-2-methylmalate dehydratase small subunit